MGRRMWAGVVAVSLAAAGLIALPTIASGWTSHTSVSVLVKFAPGTNAAEQAAVHRRNGGAAAGEIAGIGVKIVKVPGARAAATARSYADEHSVVFAELDATATATEIPDDPSLSREW